MQRPRGRSRLVRINFTSTGLTQKKKLESLGIVTEKLFENSLVAVGTLSGDTEVRLIMGLRCPGFVAPPLLSLALSARFYFWTWSPGGTLLSAGHRQASRKRKYLNDQRQETEKHRSYFFESEPVSPVGHVAAVVYRLLDLTLSSSCLTNQWIHFSSKRQQNTWFTSGSVRL